MKTTKEMIEVMQAFEAGKEIEFYSDTSHDWVYISIKPIWNWGEFDYRIKPQPKYVPFTFEDWELFLGKTVFGKSEKNCCGIINYCDTEVVLFGTRYHNYYDFFHLFTFPDGTPCGKLATDE